MSAVLVEYLVDAEPLTFDEVAAQCRIDDDSERAFIERIVIPCARQAAETKSGAAIRKARFVEQLAGFPPGAFSLTIGQVMSVESVSYRAADSEVRTKLDERDYELIQTGRESVLGPCSSMGWPNASGIKIQYQAGINIARYPSVRSWILLAAAWAYEHRELFAKGQAITAMPDGYADVLLAPICVGPRF